MVGITSTSEKTKDIKGEVVYLGYIVVDQEFDSSPSPYDSKAQDFSV